MRLFVALMLPEAAQAHFRSLTGRWKDVESLRTAKFVETFHVTLKFLGEVPAGDVDALSDALGDALGGMGVFDVTGGEFGAFPNARRASVLWQGIDRGAGSLAAAARRVEKGVAALGFPRERRPFRPHVTIARLREPTNLSGWFSTLEPVSFPPFAATEFALVRSELFPNGAVYTVLRPYPLEGNATSPPLSSEGV